MEGKTNVLGIIAVIGLLMVVVYFFVEPTEPDDAVQFKEIPRFESYAALAKAFKDAQTQGMYGYRTLESLNAPTAAGKADSEAGTDFSTTNIQVEGVDEADIVKSDGKYIYAFSQDKMVITDAYPIESAKIVSKTLLEGIYPYEMFVSGNRLLLFGSKSQAYPEYDVMPYYYYGGATVARLYDISDRGSPKMEKELEFEGSYLTSRLIGENAYFVINSWPNYRVLEGEEENIIPLMKEDGIEKRIAEATEVGYIPPMPAQSFVTLVSLDLGSKETQKETIAGSAESVYASQKSIYLAASVWVSEETTGAEQMTDAIMPLVVAGEQKTVVNKFGLKGSEIGFVGQGSVPGTVLNQFSMDEFEGNFRIATTVGHVSRTGSESTNNLYVLDKEMNLVGSLEDLAPGERIYSARFMGKKAYMVTFRKVDPLFVIDVSNPKNPKVLGKLKIPGYSDYLHPIDETHIIGIGKETIEANYGEFAWYQGLKMAIFDVSDVSNPVEMHKIVIGDRGTDSYALQDHKAFLYDKEKELLVLPIMLAEIPEEEKKPLEDEMVSPTYGTPTFQGAFVFKVGLDSGFVERGRITHMSEEDELKRGYYFGGEYSVKRAMYIGNVLYTLSGRMLKANSLETLEALKELPFE